MHVNSFKDLDVYKLSRQVSLQIFETSRQFPKEEMYSLIDQIRRSSRSVGAQIAEAWAKRQYKKHFISKIIPKIGTDGEQQETQHWIETAMDCGYITSESGNKWLKSYNLIGRMLNSMITKADSFCSK
ncbi:MAG: four helix bundle protein [Candidatus Marinimicrobia bacterium]|nr:four helix bundle protein [Candidatus Neomarinimicrobiota bacterium]